MSAASATIRLLSSNMLCLLLRGLAVALGGALVA